MEKSKETGQIRMTEFEKRWLEKMSDGREWAKNPLAGIFEKLPNLDRLETLGLIQRVRTYRTATYQIPIEVFTISDKGRAALLASIGE